MLPISKRKVIKKYVILHEKYQNDVYAGFNRVLQSLENFDIHIIFISLPLANGRCLQ